MKIKLVHPPWIHLPAIIILVGMVVYTFVGSPLPVNVPVHFGFNGQPNAYGSPWLAIGLTIGLSLFFISTSVLLDELWARQEKAKAFNWFSLMDEITVGAMVGINLGYLAFLRHDSSRFSFPWNYLIIVGGGATILAVLLEMARPFRLYPGNLIEQKSQTLKEEIERRLKAKSPFVYWDYQNPLWVNLLTILLPLIFLITGVLVWFEQPWMSVIFIIIAVSVIPLYGGQRVLVTRRDITVRWGILGIRVLALNMEDIIGVEKHGFSPLRDFGGYGIRFNGEMKAYFMRGNRGVKLTTTSGKKYLIGSDNVDYLATIISAVATTR